MSASSSHAMLVPMAVLALWTLHVLLLVPIARFRAGRAGQVSAEDFRLGESMRVPEHVSLPNRNFMNLLEAPLLWYLASFVAMIIGADGVAMQGLSWLYVALRITHSLVHLRTGHNVLLRALIFGLSNLVVAVMWWWLLVRLLTA